MAFAMLSLRVPISREGCAVEPTLAIVGLNYRTSPVAVREQFWIPEPQRYEALHRLLRSEGIEEVIILNTCNRTEFILWANDVPAAADSVLRFLTHEYNLRQCDWSHFYRLMDDVAFTHLFQVAAGLDSIVFGEPAVASWLRDAWQQAHDAGATGRFLDAAIQKALAVSARVRTDTAMADSERTLPYATVELAMDVLGDLSNREVLLLGAGQMGETAAKCLRNAGASKLKVMNRTHAKAVELAEKLTATAVSCHELRAHLITADVVVCSAACPHSLVGWEDAKMVAKARRRKPLVMVDIAVPRNVDPRASEVDGIYLFNIDSLEGVVRRDSKGRQTASEAANRIISDEVRGFRRRLLAERVVPTMVALRQRLEDLCHQEVEYLRKEFGPFTEDQDQVLTTLASHITQRIAGSLARELKDLPDRTNQDMLTVAVHRLFSLESSKLVVEAGREN
jgi:glutamyl-tRNA reductase